MRWYSAVLVVYLLSTGTQAFAPIYWMNAPSSGLSVTPKGFRGNAQGLSPPQELIVRQRDTNSPNMVPHFTAKADNTITWDDMGWCVEAVGRTRGDVVRVNQCNGGAAQKWNWVPDGHGRNMIQLKDSNQCFEVQEGGLSGAPIVLQDCASQMTDAWKFEESLPLETQTSAQGFGSGMRHALVTLLAFAGVGLLGVGSWLWWPQSKARLVTVGQGDMSIAMVEDHFLRGSDFRPTATARRGGNINMMADDAANSTTVKLVYFPVFARGPAAALALELSGLDWEGEFPENWAEMKPNTPFLELPVLDVPGIGRIGQEVAILNFVGMLKVDMAGRTPEEFLVSQQLLGQAEDIYQKLALARTGLFDADRAKSFWTNKDTTTHNREFGAFAYLMALEAFHTKCGAGEGKFTTSGITVGECKLWAMLHCCVMIQADCLERFPDIKKFYERFMAMEATKKLLESGLCFPGPFKQYFNA